MIGEAPHGSPYKFHGSTTGIDLKDFTIGHGSPFRMFDKECLTDAGQIQPIYLKIILSII